MHDAEKNNLSEKLDATKKAKDSGNIDDLKSTMNELNTLYSTLAPKMTSPADSDKSDNTSKSSNKSQSKSKANESEVEDADFEVVE